MTVIHVSKRLETVAMMVEGGGRLADIGTDHGFVPILLIQRNKIESAIAMDIGEGPLNRAREHVSALGLSDRVEFRLSDGMKELKKGEADCAVIAGMGGNLIIKILKEGNPKDLLINELVLAPQSEIEKVREYLKKNGFCVDSEEMVFEEGKFYPIIHVKGYCDNIKIPDTDEERIKLLYGEVLLEKRHPVLKQYLANEKRILEGILAELEKRETGTDRVRERKNEVSYKCRLNALAGKVYE
ncbi:MAG: class I SAM-dependent methyltransferase [Lachnospiraceae bacterium]|nr:class I SAM-dependent methyltransferase [Lachnospiraceae bacterium]